MPIIRSLYRIPRRVYIPIFMAKKLSPKQFVSMVGWFLGSHTIVAIFRKMKNPVWDHRVFPSPACSESQTRRKLTSLPSGLGSFGGLASVAPPKNSFQSQSLKSDWSINGYVGSKIMLELCLSLRYPKMRQTAPRCPSWGIAEWEDKSEALVMISIRPNSTIRPRKPICDW